mmetsp:Transcript_60613/g.179709  ORF Transcript_60613/g.179709 Transcript_60613/m.179709 type:complete len:283 (-) Transcript_60613:2045-2893(-)
MRTATSTSSPSLFPQSFLDHSTSSMSGHIAQFLTISTAWDMNSFLSMTLCIFPLMAISNFQSSGMAGGGALRLRLWFWWLLLRRSLPPSPLKSSSVRADHSSSVRCSKGYSTPAYGSALASIDARVILVAARRRAAFRRRRLLVALVELALVTAGAAAGAGGGTGLVTFAGEAGAGGASLAAASAAFLASLSLSNGVVTFTLGVTSGNTYFGSASFVFPPFSSVQSLVRAFPPGPPIQYSILINISPSFTLGSVKTNHPDSPPPTNPPLPSLCPDMRQSDPL